MTESFRSATYKLFRINFNIKSPIMKKILILSLLATTLLLSSCRGSKGSSSVNTKPIKKDGVHFVKSESLSAVLDAAAKENKFVFVDFYTTWCLPCKLMDEEVFPDKAMGEFFQENFISYKVDAEKGNGINLATIYNVSAFPTLLFLDEKGRTVERNDGSLGYTALREMAERAAAQRAMQ